MIQGHPGLWQHVIHGFHVNGMLQAYSAPRFNITSGVTTLQGTAGRPTHTKGRAIV